MFPKPKITYYSINADAFSLDKFNLSLPNESKLSQQNLSLPFDKETNTQNDTSSKKIIRLYRKEDGIYLNDLKLFSLKSHHKDMSKQLAILKILADHYKYEISHGNCFLSTAEICSRLEHEFGFYISNDQFFLLIHRLRSRSCLHLNDFISSESRKGYRLNDNVIVIRPDEMKCKTFEMKGNSHLTHCFSSKYSQKVKG